MSRSASYAYPYPDPVRPMAPTQAGSAEARLASAIIHAAVVDAGGRGPDRRSAIEFLEGRTPMLQFWASVAGLDVGVVSRLARQALSERRAAPAPPRLPPPRVARPGAAGAVELRA